MGYTNEIKTKIFNDFYYKVFDISEKLCQQILDSYMLFKGKEEIERLIRIDVGRLLLAHGIKLPSDVFAIPDTNPEFDPPRSEYETCLLFKFADDHVVNMSINMVVDRVEKYVTFTKYTTNMKLVDSNWEPIGEKYGGFMLTFEQLSEIRKAPVS